jgi:hypothetical protein
MPTWLRWVFRKGEFGGDHDHAIENVDRATGIDIYRRMPAVGARAGDIAARDRGS